MSLIQNQFEIIEEPEIKDFLKNFIENDMFVIAGGYPSYMYLHNKIYHKSDIDIFCPGCNILTLIKFFKTLYPTLLCNIIHPKLVECTFENFHRSISFIQVEQKTIYDVLNDFDSSYCQAAICGGKTYITEDLMIAKNTNENFYYLFPRKNRVEKMKLKNFKFAGYQYKEIDEEFVYDNTNAVIFNNVNCIGLTDFAAHEDINGSVEKNLIEPSGSTNNYFVSNQNNYFIPNELPYYSKLYIPEENKKLYYSKQRNGIICPYYLDGTKYGDKDNRIYVSFVLNFEGKLKKLIQNYFIGIEEFDSKYTDYLKLIIENFCDYDTLIQEDELCAIVSKKNCDPMLLDKKSEIRIQIFLINSGFGFKVTNKLLSVKLL